jgi:tetratricopeptide (TPR) repeat protein
MPRVWSSRSRLFLTLLLAAGASVVTGCENKQSPQAPEVLIGDNLAPGQSNSLPGEAKPGPRGDGEAALDLLADAARTPEEKYDAAVAEAFRLLAAGDEEKALAALQAALAVKETPFVKAEIERVKGLIARNTAADKTTQDIQAVLAAGRAEEAAKLAADALQQFGDSDTAAQLIKLKRQADALLATQLEGGAGKQRFLDEAEAARKANNFRAAVLAYDQALASGAEVAGVKDRYEDIRVKLTQYDQGRSRASELRQDAYQLEEAVVALKAAAQAWDTPQVRQEIGECEAAIQNRRDRVAVAEFEVNGDVGIPRAGHVLAEEILPHFKARFDLVERGQVASLLKELQLEAADLNVNERSRAELGRLAKARFMVLGSISQLNGVTVNARLVDVRTGLIVQTGKVVAATPEDVVAQLPALARILMMSDEQKIQFEREQASRVQLAPPVLGNLPPPPQPPAAQVSLPPPIIINAPRPPEFGVVVIRDFEVIPVAPAVPGPPVVVFQAAAPVRERAVFLSVEIGDNLFRRGRFHEAMHHFEFALSLAPERRDLSIRIDNCRPFLPPPEVIVVQPVPLRPRLAILPFVEIGRPGFVSPGLGVWAAEQIAPYFAPACDIVDQGELFWWMARLGLTYRDVLVDPAARLCLARALNARHFLMGALEETFSFDAKTYLIDTEFNVLIGSGRVHVHNPFELKCRLGELARLTSMTPAERAVVLRQADQYEALVLEARNNYGRNEFALSITIGERALALRPDSVEVRILLDDTRRRQRLWEMEEARRLAFEQQQAQLRDMQRQQLMLATAAEQARRRAERETVGLAIATQQLLTQQRNQAQVMLVAQARTALQTQNYPLAQSSYQSALALNPNPALVREIAQAEVIAAQQQAQVVAQQQAAQQAALQRQREAEIAQAKAQLVVEHRRRIDEEKVRQQQETTRANAEYDRLLDAAQKAQAQGKLDVQVSALQTARRLKPSPEIDRMVNAALIDQAKAVADKKGADARAQLERDLAAERERRIAAEAKAKENQDKYQQALRTAKAAMAEKKYDQAVSQYRLASLTVQTDEAANGLKQAQDALARAQAAAKAQAEAQQREQQKDAQFRKLLADGKTAAAAKQYGQAVQAFQAAIRLKPGDVEAQGELVKAQQARDEVRVAERKKDPPAKSVVTLPAVPAKDTPPAVPAKQTTDEEKFKGLKVQSLVAQARRALAARQFDSAEKTIAEAAALLPNDPGVQQVQKDLAQAKQAMAAEAAAEVKKRQQAYQDAIRLGQTALAAKRYDDAVNAFTEALRQAPNDKDATQLLQQAQKLKADAATAAMAEAERRKAYDALMLRGRTALASRKFAEATEAFREALKIVPNDLAAAKGLSDAQVAMATPKVEPKLDPPPKVEPKPKEPLPKLDPLPKVDPIKLAYNQRMEAGRKAMEAKQYAVAAQHFAEALKLMPNDVEATKALTAARDAAQPPPKVEPKPKEPLPKVDPKPKVDLRQAQFTQAMQTGTALENQNKYAEALKAYQVALQLVPTDASAQKKVDFCKEMVDGQRELAAGKFADAAQSFDQALKLYPDSADAKRGLQQAKAGGGPKKK